MLTALPASSTGARFISPRWRSTPASTTTRPAVHSSAIPASTAAPQSVTRTRPCFFRSPAPAGGTPHDPRDRGAGYRHRVRCGSARAPARAGGLPCYHDREGTAHRSVQGLPPDVGSPVSPSLPEGRIERAPVAHVRRGAGRGIGVLRDGLTAGAIARLRSGRGRPPAVAGRDRSRDTRSVL